MCVNCNILLPVKQEIIDLYDLPNDSLMSIRQLGQKVINNLSDVCNNSDNYFETTNVTYETIKQNRYELDVRATYHTIYGRILTGKINVKH